VHSITICTAAAAFTERAGERERPCRRCRSVSNSAEDVRAYSRRIVVSAFGPETLERIDVRHRDRIDEAPCWLSVNILELVVYEALVESFGLFETCATAPLLLKCQSKF